MMEKKKVIFSGVQPSGELTLGNYLGALKNWAALQDEYNCAFSVVDLHSITVKQDPASLRQKSIDVLALFIACGIDPEKNLLFFQSHVPQHAQLSWVLGCFTYMGELSRMTQFKDKASRHQDNINAGLFTYPVLMAADILLYQTDLVPVGNDQKQHLELARDIAQRINNLYGNVFKVPQPYIPKVGARIMSLQDPTKKMSKSDENPNAYISLLDKPEVIMKKIKRAVTDSGSEVKYAEGKYGINNLLNIYCAMTNKSIGEAEAEFEGKGYGDFKQAVGEAVVEGLRPIQEKYYDLISNRDYLEGIYKKGAQTASQIADRTLKKLYKKIGFVV